VRTEENNEKQKIFQSRLDNFTALYQLLKLCNVKLATVRKLLIRMDSVGSGQSPAFPGGTEEIRINKTAHIPA
jgi:hypothetical protein